LSYKEVEIILIDNGSTDGSGARIHAEFPSVAYRHFDKNLGFSEGNNAGMRIAFERGAAYVLLLNNDTIVDPHFIEPLLEFDSTNNKIGAQCGKIYYLSEPQTLWYAGGNYSIDKAVSAHRGMYEPDTGRYDAIEDTEFTTGCMMFIRRTVLDDVGLLDNSFFAYFEDADWCLRARNLGYRIIYNPRARIWHEISATSKVDSPAYLYLHMRNKILMVHKHGRPGRWMLFLPYYLYFFGRHLLRKAIWHRSWTGIQAIIAGIRDGLTGYTAENGEGRLRRFASAEIN
jgi:GT2 family glycosyltransferase